MNTFQISCFLAVAEYLSFARAAEQLHVTHPAVSQQIQSLERELNVKLFRRTTRTVKLTEEGKAFLNDAKQIIAISVRAKKRFETASPSQIKTLSLGCYSYPCMFLLTDTLKKLQLRCPELHPWLQVIQFQHIYQLLEEGDLDAIIGFQEPSAQKIHALYREIAKVPLVCICSCNNPLSELREVTVEQLKTHPLVLFAPHRAAPPVVQLQGQLIGDKQPAELYFCESAEAITVLVVANYGISVLPAFLVPDIPELSVLPLAEVEPASFGIYYKSLQGNALLREFMHCARESFSV